MVSVTSTPIQSHVPLLFALLAGCAVHRVGHVEATVDQVELIAGNGHAERLALLGDARPLARLDGHLVDLYGRKAFGAIQVGRWRAIEGPHGMQVWIGPVVRYGAQLGITDAETGELVTVDARTAREFAGHLGEMVAIEGYVEGTAHVAVVDWTSLE